MKLNTIATAMVLATGLTVAGTASAAYPDKTITMYVSYAAGGTTDVTARALAQGLEKQLGVPVAVENKGGGGGTVSATLLANQKPDGYTLMVTSSGVVAVRPIMMKVAYKPTDFTLLMKFSDYEGALVVRKDAPWQTIDEFTAYAEKNPGMTYASSGPHTQQQIGVETYAQCKNLSFKHVPQKGGSGSNTQLMGGHVDFIAGSGSHLPFVQQGEFRELLVFHKDARDPTKPDIPVMSDIGCPPNNPALGMMVVAPLGLPPEVAKTLEEALKKASEEESFQNLLKKYNLPYSYKGAAQLAADLPKEAEWYQEYLSKQGVTIKN